MTRDLLAFRSKLQFFGPGALRRTENPADLAVVGTGFFIVRSPMSGDLLATRRGTFHFDEAGYLVAGNGWRVQGYGSSDLTAQGDVRLDTRGILETSSPATIASWSFDTDGRLNIDLSDGTQFVSGQILLQNFAQSYLLAPAGNGFYTNLFAAQPLPSMSAPGTQGLGKIQAGALEIPWKPGKLVLPPRHGIRLLVTGEPGSRCTVQTMMGFKKWRTLGVVTLGSNGEAEFVDLRSKDRATRPYRMNVEWSPLLQ